MNLRHAIRRGMRYAGEQALRLSGLPTSLRRWEAAKTDRLNQEHWKGANTNSINRDLSGNLEVLRNRIALELANNPHVEGIVSTHIIDVVGPDGPTLQVQSSDDTYNRMLQDIFWKWWQMPDINGVLSGVDFLRQAVRRRWDSGDFLWQLVNEPVPNGGIRLRLHNIHPKQLKTPFVFDPAITLGVKRSARGKPISYFIETADDGEFGFMGIGAFTEIPASQMIHGHDPIEPGQSRTIPWLASSLQVTADLRDYDAQVLDAVRQAADWAIYLHTEHPDSTYLPVNESTDVERRTISTLPPGWKPSQLVPNQPHVQYIEYRNARLREIGRPVNMPLMMITLDSSEHNYSSARFDGQIYQRGNRAIQGWLERVAMNRLVDMIAREAELLGLLPARPAPKKRDDALGGGDEPWYQWIWPQPPHVDPYKEVNADKVELELGITTMAEKAAKRGLDIEAVMATRDREQRAANALLVDQIKELEKRCIDSGVPNFHWYHVMASGGAVSAPGAFLQGAAGSSPSTPDPELMKDDPPGGTNGGAKKKSTPPGEEANRIAALLKPSMNGAH